VQGPEFGPQHQNKKVKMKGHSVQSHFCETSRISGSRDTEYTCGPLGLRQQGGKGLLNGLGSLWGDENVPEPSGSVVTPHVNMPNATDHQLVKTMYIVSQGRTSANWVQEWLHRGV
jgi:hypothetical protein